LVVAQWGSHVWAAYQAGIVDFDSANYHLPVAAQFAQQGWTSRVPVVGVNSVAQFHTENVELLHAVGMVAFRADILSPIINLGWLLLALFSGWCVGLRKGVSSLTLLAVATAVSIPVLVVTNAGTAGTDVAALALILAAAAFVAVDPVRTVPLSGLAAGLAIGSKENAGAVALAMFVLVVVAARRKQRIRTAVVWAGAALIGGSYWFIRNFARLGNPVPTISLSVGPLHLRSPALPFIEQNDHNVAQYLTDSNVLRDVFEPSYRASFGRAALVLIAIVAVALVVALRQSGRSRWLAAVALAAAAAYTVTPLTAFGPEGHPSPQLFGLNLRYLIPAVALALLAGSLALERSRRTVVAGAVVGLALTTLASLTSSTYVDAWPVSSSRRVVLVVAVAGALATSRFLIRSRSFARWTAAVVAMTVIALATGSRLSNHYLDSRYSGASVDPVEARAAQLDGVRLGVVGLQRTYVVVGDRLQNRTEYVGTRIPHGALVDTTSCAVWRSQLATSGADYVLIAVPETSGTGARPAAFAWAPTAPGLALVERSATVELYRVVGAMDNAGCDGS
jgi:hypothetical protein